MLVPSDCCPPGPIHLSCEAVMREGVISGSESLAWGAPGGGGAGLSAASQELGGGQREVAEGSDQLHFLKKGWKNSSSPAPSSSSPSLSQVVAHCSQGIRSVLQSWQLPSLRIQHLLTMALWEARFHCFQCPIPKESVHVIE